MIAFWDSAM